MNSGSFDSYRSALSGTGADFGGEPDDDRDPPAAIVSCAMCCRRMVDEDGGLHVPLCSEECEQAYASARPNIDVTADNPTPDEEARS